MRPCLSFALACFVVCASGCAGGGPAPVAAREATPAARAPAGAASGAGRGAAPDGVGAADADRVAEFGRRARAMLDAFGNENATFVEGGRVAFLSDRDGVSQLYVAPAGDARAPAERLLATGQRVLGASSTPDGKGLLFLSDQDADEQGSIFRLDLATRRAVELTPGERLSRDFPFVPARGGGRLFFSARSGDSPATSIYEASTREAVKPRLVYRDEGFGSLSDVSPDGRLGLFTRSMPRPDNSLFAVDLKTGAARKLYPRPGAQPAQITNALFSGDGARAFVATDEGAERAALLALDVATGAELARYVEARPATASIEGLCASPRGDLVALTLNAGNRSEVRLLDARRLVERARVDVPLGEGYAGEFSKDGARLTLSWSTPDTPKDVYVVDAASGRVSRLRDEPRPGFERAPALRSSIAEVRAFDGLSLPVNVFLPEGGAVGRRPVIVRYHGGPAGSAAMRWSPAVRFFASLGYAWVEPNVRGSAGFGRAFEAADDGPRRLDAFRDVEVSARWVAQQPWADASKLVAYGESYGGYTVLASLTRHPDLWRAGVDLSGIANLETLLATTTGAVLSNYRVELGDPRRDRDFLRSISPLNDIDKARAPLFVYAGANDPRVPRAEADQVVAALRGRAVPVEYMLKEDEGHSIERRDNLVEYYARVANFLERHLR